MIQLIINEMPVAVEPGTTVLEAARQHGVEIPTLCYVKAIRPNQACRLCVVEAEGPGLPKGVFSSCDLPASEGLVVTTESSRLTADRRTILEMLLASMPGNAKVAALAAAHGVVASPFALTRPDSCLLCGICIEACRAKIGMSALSFAARSEGTAKVAETVRLNGELCVGCGTCANLCPVGAIEVADRGDRRELSLYGEVANSLELASCTACGAHFATVKVVDLLKERLATQGLELDGRYCPTCARFHTPAPSTAYVQTGERA